MKTCTKCGAIKHHDDFPLDRRTPGKLDASCKECKAKKARAWRAANKERAREVDRARYADSPKRWGRHISDVYGLSPDEYMRILSFQGGTCAICKQASAKRLSVDHNHITGAVRGLLCASCNRMLGQARDNPSTLVAGADYLNAVQAQAFIEAFMDYQQQVSA